MLEVPLDLSSIGVHKGLSVTQVVTKKHFELDPRNRDRAVCVPFLLILRLAETYPILEERYGKRNLDKSCIPSGGKIVFVLLTEDIAVYVGLSTIYVWGTSL